MDELRRRLAAELQRRDLKIGTASERAELSHHTLRRLVNNPRAVASPKTCRAIAAFFGWPEEEVFRWAGHLSPKRNDDPYGDIHRALYRLPLDEGLRGTIIGLLRHALGLEDERGRSATAG